jgi:hypothetical protein
MNRKGEFCIERILLSIQQGAEEDVFFSQIIDEPINFCLLTRFLGTYG